MKEISTAEFLHYMIVKDKWEIVSEIPNYITFKKNGFKFNTSLQFHILELIEICKLEAAYNAKMISEIK